MTWSGRLLALKWKLRHQSASLVNDPRAFFAMVYGAVLCIWLAYATRRVLHTPPGGFCSDAPSSWLSSAGVNSSALPVEVEFGGALHFMSIWTTDATNWGERNVAGVESVFFHHPNASLRIYSNHLPLSAVAPLAARGLDVRVLPYSLDALLRDTPAAPWLGELARWERGPYFYTHVTDVIRLALLFRDGGVYVDTDVILVRPFRIERTPPEPPPAPRRALGREAVERLERLSARGVASLGPPPPLTPHALGAEAHTINDTPILNGAIMVFARGSPFLWGAMKEFAKTYRDYEWGWNGPELLTRVRRRCPHNVTVLGEDAFYPFHWEEVERYSTDGRHARDNELMWEVVTTRSYAAHLWNKKSNALELASSSVYARLMREFRLPPPAAAPTAAAANSGEAAAAKS